MTSPLDILGAVMRPATFGERPRFVGVYLLICGQRVVYVGQSIDVEERIYTHKHNRNSVRFGRALWFPVRVEDLDAYEGALIRALLPHGNSTAPRHRGRDNEVLRALGLPEHVDEHAHAAWYVANHDSLRRPRKKSDLAFHAVIRQKREREGQRARAQRLFAGIESLLAARAA